MAYFDFDALRDLLKLRLFDLLLERLRLLLFDKLFDFDRLADLLLAAAFARFATLSRGKDILGQHRHGHSQEKDLCVKHCT